MFWSNGQQYRKKVLSLESLLNKFMSRNLALQPKLLDSRERTARKLLLVWCEGRSSNYQREYLGFTTTGLQVSRVFFFLSFLLLTYFAIGGGINFVYT
jgi:hypothetical protein